MIRTYLHIFMESGWLHLSNTNGCSVRVLLSLLLYSADYMSGWDVPFLQSVLDNCENDSFAPMPNAFCEDFVTFRDGPKCTDEETCDFADPELLAKLQAIQPDLLNFKEVSPEETNIIQGQLPRGTCNGVLLPRPPACSDSPLRLKIPKDGGIVTRSCEWAARADTAMRCALPGVSAACPVTCGSCGTCADPELRFKFTYKNKSIARSCAFVGRIEGKVGGRCAASQNICRRTCGTCSSRRAQRRASISSIWMSEQTNEPPQAWENEESFY